MISAYPPTNIYIYDDIIMTEQCRFGKSKEFSKKSFHFLLPIRIFPFSLSLSGKEKALFDSLKSFLNLFISQVILNNCMFPPCSSHNYPNMSLKTLFLLFIFLTLTYFLAIMVF